MAEYYGAPNDFRNYLKHSNNFLRHSHGETITDAQANTIFRQLKLAVNNAGLGNLRAVDSWSLNELSRRVANNPTASSNINSILQRLRGTRVLRDTYNITQHQDDILEMTVDFEKTKVGDSLLKYTVTQEHRQSNSRYYKNQYKQTHNLRQSTVKAYNSHSLPDKNKKRRHIGEVL